MFSFIHSFIHRGHFYSASSSPLLLRSALDTGRILCRSFTPKRHRQLWVKDLPKVPTWRLERDSNPRPSGRKASTLPMRHHVPWYWDILHSISKYSILEYRFVDLYSVSRASARFLREQSFKLFTLGLSREPKTKSTLQRLSFLKLNLHFKGHLYSFKANQYKELRW